MGPDGNLETGWGGRWVVDELFVQVPSVTVGVRNDEKRPAIHTLGSVHRLHGPSLTPLTEGVGSCSSWAKAEAPAVKRTKATAHR